MAEPTPSCFLASNPGRWKIRYGKFKGVKTYEEIVNIRYGKFKGVKTYEEIVNEDPEYAKWLANIDRSKGVRNFLKQKLKL